MVDEPTDASDWKKQPWASRATREEREERKLRKKLSPKDQGEGDWQGARRRNPDNHDRLHEILEDHRETRRRYLPQEMAEGAIAEAGKSDDEKTVAMQEMINGMAASSGLFPQSPTLLVHQPASLQLDYAADEVLNASADLPEYIDINQFTVDYLRDHTDQAKAVFAHEMGHLANKDRDVKNVADRIVTPLNQREEVLADRMAAIIHGNPMEYARASIEFKFERVKRDKTDPDHYETRYLSPNDYAWMLHKWADMLAEYRWTDEGHPWNDGRGATDDKGNVILDRDVDGTPKPLRALAVMERSKEFTDMLTKAHLETKHPGWDR